ncbi:helix-turn-helix domain-containing protein [Aquimarina sp. AD1]|uniref:helix-turn-helix domain-containing protein n=1 Tax=Aquimarina TaxID=290174 RepID=UPI0003FE4A54|nr:MULTISPECIES: helix-turn-helix domain-containing protein [Aquimarina]AXT56432.1 helix-turn-helix domain-containing protein [Aquimarina sp. AD1]RKN12975.1 helix-turn-helix domain-containing protein [Aquimarina sp. AD1]
MKEKIKHIKFDNKTNPKSYFEVVQLEELLNRKLDHDICKNHIVKFYIIIFITEGNGYHTIDFVDYKYQKGSVLLVRKDQIQKFSKSATAKGYLLIFTEEFIVSHINKLEALKSFQLFNELISFPKIELQVKEHEFSDFYSLMEQIVSEYKLKDEYSISITRSALHILITKLFRIKFNNGQLPNKKKYLTEFLLLQDMVEKNCFANKKVMYYAQNMGCSTKTLNNIVQAIINKPAKNFIDEIAITQIKRLLIGTNESVKEIAYTSGFDDPANFFKYFKKFVGSSPEAFRRSHQ